MISETCDVPIATLKVLSSAQQQGNIIRFTAQVVPTDIAGPLVDEANPILNNNWDERCGGVHIGKQITCAVAIGPDGQISE